MRAFTFLFSGKSLKSGHRMGQIDIWSPTNLKKNFCASRNAVIWHTIPKPKAHPPQVLVWLQETQGLAKPANVHVKNKNKCYFLIPRVDFLIPAVKLPGAFIVIPFVYLGSPDSFQGNLSLTWDLQPLKVPQKFLPWELQLVIRTNILVPPLLPF